MNEDALDFGSGSISYGGRGALVGEGLQQQSWCIISTPGTTTTPGPPGPEDEKAWLRRRVREVLWTP